jgi:hypothetical protein
MFADNLDILRYRFKFVLVPHQFLREKTTGEEAPPAYAKILLRNAQ